MKKIFFCKLFLFLSAFFLSAPFLTATEHLFTMEKAGEFRATFQRDFAKTSFIAPGVSGKCFKAILPAGEKIYAVHSLLKQKAENVRSLYISGYFKGRGSFRIGFILYGKDHKIFWLPAPGVYSPVIKLDTQKWEKHSFTLEVPEKYAENITGFLTAIVLLPGTELYMDDIQTKIINNTEKKKEKEIK